MEAIYYVYTHTRIDTNSIFYVGIGTDTTRKFTRANDLRCKKRNFMWANVHGACAGKIKVDVIFQYNTLEEVFSKEIELIKQYGKLIDKQGGILANLSDGGEYGGTAAGKLIQYSKAGKPLRIWDNIYVAAEHFNIAFKPIYQAIHRLGICMEYQWRWYDDETKKLGFIPKYTTKKMKTIYQFDLEGKYLATFESTAKAAEKTKIDRASINNCALGNRTSAGGFVWSFNDTVEVLGRKTVNQLTMEGKLIKAHSSYGAAMKALKKKSSTAIRNCVLGNQTHAYGFKWTHEIINYENTQL